MYYLAECVLKAAYLAFYADLYARVQTNRRHAIWIATFIWVASYVSAILVLFTYCLPFEQNWYVVSDYSLWLGDVNSIIDENYSN